MCRLPNTILRSGTTGKVNGAAHLRLGSSLVSPHHSPHHSTQLKQQRTRRAPHHIRAATHPLINIPGGSVIHGVTRLSCCTRHKHIPPNTRPPLHAPKSALISCGATEAAHILRRNRGTSRVRVRVRVRVGWQPASRPGPPLASPTRSAALAATHCEPGHALAGRKTPTPRQHPACASPV